MANSILVEEATKSHCRRLILGMLLAKVMLSSVCIPKLEQTFTDLQSDSETVDILETTGTSSLNLVGVKAKLNTLDTLTSQNQSPTRIKSTGSSSCNLQKESIWRWDDIPKGSIPT